MILLDFRWTLCLFATISDLPSDESGNLLNMIMDSGAEEHVVSWRSLGEPVLKPAQVRLRSTTGDTLGVFWQFLWCVDGVIIKWWS